MKTPYLFAAIEQRHSVRRFKPNPIEDTILHQIMEAARWAPSGGNGQAHCFGLVSDSALRQALAEAAGGQRWIAEAPIVIACCAHLTVLDEQDEFTRRVNDLRWGSEASRWLAEGNPMHRELLLQNAVPLIAGAHIQLAATAHGLGTCWIGYLDIAKASAILGLPDDWRCYFLMPLGYPAKENQKRRTRKPLEEITFGNGWGQRWETKINSSPRSE